MRIDELVERAGRLLGRSTESAKRPSIEALQARRRYRRTLGGLIASLSVASLVALFIVSARPTQLAPVAALPPASAPDTASGDVSGLGAAAQLGWTTVEIPPEVSPCPNAAVATDAEVIFWGGDGGTCDYQLPRGDPGMAYSLNENFWRKLPASPLDPAVTPTAVWTGSEMLVCCGLSSSRQAAAYNPRSDRWRELAAPPISGAFPESVWTGEYMLVVTYRGVVAYHLETDEWQTMPAPPLHLGRTNEVVWTGTELVVWPSDVQRQVFRGVALDLSQASWRILPDPPVWPAAPDLAFTGDQLIIWGGLPATDGGSERAVGAIYDLSNSTWETLPNPLPGPSPCECNLGSQTLLWQGDQLLVDTGHLGTGLDASRSLLLAYEPSESLWRLVGESPLQGGITYYISEQVLVIRSDREMFLVPDDWTARGELLPDRG